MEPVILPPTVGSHRCGTCKFHQPHGPGGKPHCKRYPPAVVAVPELFSAVPAGAIVQTGGGAKQMDHGGIHLNHVNVQLMFPPTSAENYCGEWKPRLMAADGSQL